MRRLLVVLLVVAVLAVVADRVAVAYASRTLAAELQTSGALPSRPSVDVGGFPFLTQALGGRYDRIEVRASSVPAGDIVVADLEAVLVGARVPLSDALRGRVTAVPVDRVEAQVRLPYDVLSRRSGSRRLTVTPAGDRVRVTGSVDVLGQRLSAAAISRVTLEGDELVVTATAFEVGNVAANAVLTRALGSRLDLRVAVQDLPYGLRVDGVTVQDDGIRFTASADDTVLTPR